MLTGKTLAQSKKPKSKPVETVQLTALKSSRENGSIHSKNNGKQEIDKLLNGADEHEVS